MGIYATTADVQARVPYREINDTSKPSVAQVSAWIDEAEAMLAAKLRLAGCAVPVESSDGRLMVRSWLIDYPVALLLMAYASAGGDGTNDDGEAEAKRFADRLQDIESQPAVYAAELGGVSSSTAVRFRGPTLATTASEPEFVRGTVW